jgi:phage-related protein
LRWFVPSRDEIRAIPEDVKHEIGYLLSQLQNGEHLGEKNIKPFGEDRRISHLIKIVVDGDDGNTYRTAATAGFPEGIWVLDVFEKRSTSGIGTPKKDLDRIANRLKRLKEHRTTGSGFKASMMAETEANLRNIASAAAIKTTRKPGGR